MKNILYTILFTLSLSAQAQMVYETDLPLTVPQSGDTTILLTTSFHIGGENFVPQGTVTLKWVHSLLIFHLYGLANTTIDGQTFSIHFGTESDSRVQIGSNGVFTLFSPFVVDNFTIQGQKFIGAYDSTHYNINFFNHNIEVYGNVQIIVDNTPYRADMGDMGHPGFVYNDSGADVWVHMKDKLEIKGLVPAGRPNIVIKHTPGDPTNTYYGRGEMVVNMYDDILAASLGSNKKPGLILTDSKVDSASLTLAGGGLLFGLLPILNYFEMEFNHHHNQWAINGKVILGVPMGGVVKALGAKYAPSVIIDAGSKSTAGFLYNTSTHKFTVNDAVFQLKNVNGSSKVELGGFELNNLALKVENNIPDSINAIVTLPPGFGVDASLAWELTPEDPHYPFVITSIEAQFAFKDINLCPPIGSTGFLLASMGGGITNLNKPKDMTFFGDMGLIYGDPITIDLSLFGITGKKTIALAYVNTEVALNSHGLSLSANGQLGSYFSEAKWNPILGDGKIMAELDWGGKTKLDIDMDIYGVPKSQYLTAKFDLNVNNKGDMDGLGSVSVMVPKFIPLIGGKHIAKAEGAIRHQHDAISHSYAAGWFKINLGFDKLHLGIKQSFDGNTKKIGAGAQKAIVKQITSEQQSPGNNIVYCSVNHHFNQQFSVKT